MNTYSLKIQTCHRLLIEFNNKNINIKGQKLNFTGVDGKDVYNITAPFEENGEIIIAGRVESRDSEYSEIIFFTLQDDVWQPRKDTVSFKLQDPAYTRIGGELVLLGVEVWAHPNIPEKLQWHTVFYKGKNINDLKLLTKGPIGMKDIRLIELEDGRIGVFTRPQGEIGGKGQIGFTIIDSLKDLNAETITKAALIKGQFSPNEWGGSNEVHMLKNGLLGVLGHISCFDKMGNRHYYSMVFSLNPYTREVYSIKLIATRANFEACTAKRQDLTDVIFSGGLIRQGNGKAELFVGVSDVEAHRVIMPDPFDEYEGVN